MKILFVANRIPYPPFRGDKLKIYNLAKRLSNKHELYLVTFVQSRNELKYIPELQKLFKEVSVTYLPKWKSALNCLLFGLGKKPFQVLYFKSTQFKKKVDELIKRINPDAIHIQHLRMAQYLEDSNLKGRVLDLPDAFSLYWKRRQEIKRPLLNRIFDSIESRRVADYESVMHKFDSCLVCSQEDLEFLKESQHPKHLYLLPNGVDLETFKPRKNDNAPSKRLLFTGNMDYAPNVDGVLYFVKEILPVIRQTIPDVHFTIAGQRPIKKISDLKTENIEVTGFVPNLADEYARAAVVVAPLRFGAGTQNKVLEAMAMGIPVVCTNIGFKGLGIENGEGVYMETDPHKFAETTIKLLQDEELRSSVGEKGHRIIQQKFNWDEIANKLELYLTKAAEQ